MGEGTKVVDQAAQISALVEKVRASHGDETAKQYVSAVRKLYAEGPSGGLAAGKSLGDCAEKVNRPNVRAPHVGETVLVDIGKAENGTRIHPGIVTRVWGPHCINVRVFADAGNDYQYNSVIHKSQIPPPVEYAQARPLYWFRHYEGDPIA